MFVVPQRKEPGKATPPVGLASGTIGVACPKCGTLAKLPESARGRNTKCGKCSSVIVVPKKPASAPA